MDGCAVEADGTQHDFGGDEVDDRDKADDSPDKEKSLIMLLFVQIPAKKEGDNKPDCT